ncbi:energy transducer TonB [Lacimicrobium alkaliphilum]|uniref:Protein TonB n=1 Tax=Lacimicrobium alkaliphilum TaxID=1526571 RepID=A0ABQ1R300_9ALTE|nr:energy transducer TonB [Lacimicrobium alkaliphilum]GGD56228.1 protein TonB [Lacimicrobium alkaliphilum]
MLRLIVSILIGAAITFALFVLMAKLIANSSRPVDEAPPAPVIDIVMNEPDQSTQTRSRVPPPPPPPPQQPPKMEPQEPDSAEPDADMAFNMPGVDVSGASVDIGDPGSLMRDGEATPIVRIEPKYPIEAARDGKEGWVRLSFTINELGGVEDIQVIDAEPKRIFDREARRALSRWKYKAKVVDGKPVKQFDMKVQLDFTLEKS